MLLGVIPMFCFGILEKNRKIAEVQKMENLGIIGLLRRSVGNPRRDIDLCQGVGYPRRGVDLCQGVGYPRRGEAEVPKWHPLGTPWRSIAAPRCCYCSKRAIFFGFLLKHIIFVHR